MIKLENIRHTYALDEVLTDINLTIEKGEIISLVGPSGCGKTTLLSMCAGLLEPSEGIIKNEFEKISMVFQEDRLLPWRQAWENIAFGLKAQGMPVPKQVSKAKTLAERLKLTEQDLYKYPHELSGGMRQRIALGRALAIDPELLLLDEPFSALDIGLKRELQDLIMEQILDRNLTTVFITHDLLEAVRISSRIIVFRPEPGQIVREIKINEPFHNRHDSYVHEQVGHLLEQDDIRSAFGLVSEAAE